jgi:hypothetical protein
VDQSAASAPVSVGEGVDGLELGVGDRGLHERRVLISVDVDREVFEELPDELGRRWDERGAAGVV